MKTTLVIAAILAGGAGAAYAQDPPAAQPPAPVTAPAAAVSETVAIVSPERLREIKLMETIFANAVRGGAEDLAHQMMQIDPGSVISTGTARARGIALAGYGVVFDVDVPLMNMSVIWTRRQMLVQSLRDQIAGVQNFLARAPNPEDQQRAQAQLRMLTAQYQALAPAAASPLPVTPVANAAAPAGVVTAQTTSDAAVAPVPSIETRDTNELYTDAVKKSLIDAMLTHSAGLILGDDEWLTVAARDNGGPSISGAIDDRAGIILRVKGSDLAAFRSNRLSRDEVLKKVEIRPWR